MWVSPSNPRNCYTCQLLQIRNPIFYPHYTGVFICAVSFLQKCDSFRYTLTVCVLHFWGAWRSVTGPLAPEVSGNVMPCKIRDHLSHWPGVICQKNGVLSHRCEDRQVFLTDVLWTGFVSVTDQLWCVAAYCTSNMKTKVIFQSFDINLLEDHFFFV